MNLKLLILPALIIVTLVLAIGYIKPDISSILAKRDEIVVQETALVQVDTVIQNARALQSAVNGRSEMRNFIVKYYPEKIDEDRAVDMFNFLAQQSGLIVMKVTMTENMVTRPVFENDPTIVVPPEGFTPEFEAGLIAKIPRSYRATVDVLGTYPNIKDFFARVRHTERLHVLNEFSIKTRKEKESEGDAAPTTEEQSGVLVGTLKLDFSFIQKQRAGNVLNNPIFQTPTFDFSSGDAVISFVTSPIPALEANNTGRANPFE